MVTYPWISIYSTFFMIYVCCCTVNSLDFFVVVFCVFLIYNSEFIDNAKFA